MNNRLLLVLIIVAGGVFLQNYDIMALVNGSPHGFSGREGRKEERCALCHTPQGPPPHIPQRTWNRGLPGVHFTKGTSDFFKKASEQPGFESTMCISCHDGTIAFDSYDSTHEQIFMTGLGAPPSGKVLLDSHPVGVKWVHKRPANCMHCHIANPSEKLNFFNGKIECATCHDPHKISAEKNFLRVPLQNSELCLFCHDK